MEYQPLIFQIKFANIYMTYTPSLDLLKKIIAKKNQPNVEKFRYFIGLRHHKDLNFLVDQLINVLVSHFNNNIYVSVSTSPGLYSQIDELKTISPYIVFTKCVVEPVEFANYMLLNSTLIDKKHIDYEYFLYHSSSEYYIRQFTMDENSIVYEKLSDDEKKPENKLSKTWHWTKYIDKCENTKIFFKNNNMSIICGQINGIILPKNVIDDFLKFLEEVDLINKCSRFDSKNLIEILLPSYVYSNFRMVKSNNVFLKNESTNAFMSKVGTRLIASITNCFWNSQHTVVEIVNDDLNKKIISYYCVKRCDNNAKLLKYIHQSYMNNMVNILLQ